MELQTAFYTLGIIFMSVMLLLTLVILIVALSIKSKVDAAQKAVADKVNFVKSIASRSGIALNTIRYFVKPRG